MTFGNNRIDGVIMELQVIKRLSEFSTYELTTLNTCNPFNAAKVFISDVLKCV